MSATAPTAPPSVREFQTLNKDIGVTIVVVVSARARIFVEPVRDQ